MKSRAVVSIAVTALLLAAPSPAQRRSAGESMRVTVVEVPVNVVGRDGAPVRGLTKDDFELLMDGKKRAIGYFEVVDTKQTAAAKAPVVSPAARRSFLLLFDLSNSSPTALERGREAARQFVDQGLERRDLAAVATWSVERGFRLLTSFTTDRSLLRGALESLGKSKTFLAADPLLLAAAPPQTAGSAQSERRSEVEAAAAEIGEDIDRQTQKMDDAWRRGRVEQQLAGLGGVARVLDRVPGRKQVILLSEGFDARLLHGSESAETGREASEASISGEIWKIDNEQRFGSTQSTARLEAMGELFRRSDVVLHAMDIQGLRSDVDAREGRRENSNESLFLMANGTGGQVFKNSNDVAASFAELMEQQQVTYVLGFQTTGTGDPKKFHELKVRVKNADRGTRVVHRPGYYDVRDEESGVERALSAVTILMNDIPRDEIRIEPMAVPFKASAGEAVVPVILEIDGRSILEGAGGKSALDGELFVYAFDGEGAVRDFLFQKIGLDLTKVAEPLRAAGLKYYGALHLPPGRYAVKALFRAGGRDGFARVDMEVPDFAKPAALPPVAFSAENRWILVKSSPRSPAETNYPFAIGADSFIPEPVADLRDGEARQVALFTYNVPAQGLELGARVRGRDGAAHPAAIEIVGRSPESETRNAKLLVRFTPKGLPPGAYSLEIDLKGGSGEIAQTVAMPFTIVSGS